ncbi:MAG TPA: hypothetical protein EYH01_01620 [Campylobacterales bacterium]|nr:hypothetical protein [Campylobacterales bacterium]
MQIELKIHDAKAGFFLEYLQSFKSDIIESIVIKDEPPFLIDDVVEVRRRVLDAEKRADFTPHDEFWDEMLEG